MRGRGEEGHCNTFNNRDKFLKNTKQTLTGCDTLDKSLATQIA